MTPEEAVSAQFAALESGDAGLAARCLHPEHVNHMAADEPADCARPGVPGLMATSAWLRTAFSGLRFEVIEIAAEGDRAIAVRDDLGMMTQLGHLPPGPAALARMARFQLTGQARTAIAQAVEAAGQAAAAAGRALTAGLR